MPGRLPQGPKAVAPASENHRRNAYEPTREFALSVQAYSCSLRLEQDFAQQAMGQRGVRKGIGNRHTDKGGPEARLVRP
jgi:hypothetical protein